MADVPPELQQLLALSRDRTAYQNPLFQATTQLAYSMLPTYARQGTALSGSLGSGIPATAPQSDGSGLGGMLGAGALGALAGNGASGNLSSLIDGLKRLFMRQRGIQGDRPYGGGALTGGGQGAPGFGGWDPGVSDQYGQPYLPSDPGVYYGQGGGGASPSDPSGGSGVGPGMQGYYDWLNGR